VGGARLLVVDDEPNICALLAATLRHVGYEVRVAHGGTAAMAVAEGYEPELAVLGAALPDLDGFQRRKLDRLGPTMIHTVRGVGYALRPPRAGDR
jgi:two-component system OmpR family response regulator